MLTNTRTETIQERLYRIRVAIDLAANGDNFAYTNGTLPRLYREHDRLEREVKQQED